MRPAATFLPTLIICLAAWIPGVQAALRCDLAYEVLPGAHAAASLGEEPMTRLAALDLEARVAFTETEAGRLPMLLALQPDASALAVSAPQVTWGGWRGASSPAIQLELHAGTAETGLPAARALAALLGWTYRQEAVLLACDASGGAGTETLAYRLRPQPADFFAQRERLFAFFGAVIGLAGDPDLGYTRLDGSFWTIDFGGGLEPALRGAATLFEDLSGGTVGFTVETRAVAAELPGNDWSTAPDGEAYLALLPGVDTEALRGIRAAAEGALLTLTEK